MENHPIPQNVTGFQFKLIGDMTIKQFVYLATGVVSGWLFFSLPITPFIKFPISIFFILAGISFAFWPLAGRPIDVIVANFIKSLFSPTQYIYRTTGAPPTIDVINPRSKMALKEELSKQVVSNTYNSPIISSQPSSPHIISMKEDLKEDLIDAVQKQKAKEEKSLKEKEEALEKELEDAKAKEESLDKKSPTSPELHQKIISLEEQMQEILIQKEQLAQQVIDLQKKLNLQNKTALAPKTLAPKAMAKDSGLPPTPDTPNVITGIVKDPRGNPLSNILVEIKDKEGNAARAFKTSLLGQFASATPLANGVYTIEFEDPKAQNKFNTVELNVTGEVIMPIEIMSIDPREELRKSLFVQQA